MVTLSCTACIAQADLEITIKNIREVKGSLRIGLFDNERDFPKKAVVGKVIAVTADSLTVVFTDLKPASYAVSVIHDENSNGKLDTNILGIPKEGFAFGNNAMGMFGPPSFKNAQVTISNTTAKQVIVLKYF